MTEKCKYTETQTGFRTSCVKKNRMRPYGPVRTLDEERNKRRPLLAALKLLTGAKRRILRYVDTGEARNPWWVSHPNLFPSAVFSPFPVAGAP